MVEKVEKYLAWVEHIRANRFGGFRSKTFFAWVEYICFGRARSKHILLGSSTIENICFGRARWKHTELWSRQSKGTDFWSRQSKHRFSVETVERYSEHLDPGKDSKFKLNKLADPEALKKIDLLFSASIE